MPRRKTIPYADQKQKVISKRLINIIMKKQKKLQIVENTKYGRKAKTISFVYASDVLARGIK